MNLPDHLNTMSSPFELQCPRCNGKHLHHDFVAVYNRANEDANTVGHTYSIPDYKKPGAPITLKTLRNPSARRSGLLVRGWCEECDARWTLGIAQHKGQTLLTLENDSE